MTARRTVTVQTLDHGAVVLHEPAWCIGIHPDGEYRVDISHMGREYVFDVDTARGIGVIARAALERRPFTQLPFGSDVFVNVELGCDHYPCDAAGLRRIARQLIAQAARFEALADQLTELE